MQRFDVVVVSFALGCIAGLSSFAATGRFDATIFYGLSCSAQDRCDGVGSLKNPLAKPHGFC